MRKRKTFWLVGACFLLSAVLAACGSGASAEAATETPLPTATFTPIPTETPLPTPTAIRTPPALPPGYTDARLNPKDTPHSYIEDTCQYLKLKWDPNNSEPGTVVMVIMFHALVEGGTTQAEKMGDKDFFKMMDELKRQGFEAINTEQLAGFLESNAKIPSRSVLLLADDRHWANYFQTYFLPYWQDYGWPVVNAWISHPETTAVLWEDNEALAAEGWVDYQAHGVVHNIPITEGSSDEYINGELQGSITAIQEHYGKTPIAIIWPGGGFTPHAAELARQAGYRLGFTINPRGPLMFNWIPLGDEKDEARPLYLPEGPVGDPLMVLPRYWPLQVMGELDTVRVMGEEAAAYAQANRATELEYYDIACAPDYGPIPGVEGE